MNTPLQIVRSAAVLIFLGTASMPSRAADGPGRWPVERAQTWQAGHGWLRGSNFMPSTAINQLEMWQAETFDEATIDRELGYAESLGFNSMRVFLHDLPWQQDAEGYARRIDRFLAIADKHHIGVLFAIFDSCWYPLPKLGPQPAPLPFTHNSGWVQSPGVAALQNPAEYPRLHAYVTGLVKRFAGDRRIHGWDVWNEPDNGDGGAVGRPGLEPKNKATLVLTLLPQVFSWAREGNPTQPLTSGVWGGDYTSDAKLNPMQRAQLENSDVISFHCYGNLNDLRRTVESLRWMQRPLLCTEYMARPNGSTFDPNLGWMKEQGVAAYNWGFVSGKTQTIYPWDSWSKHYTAEPKLWFHDILRADGTPFRQEETAYIRSVTGAPAPATPAPR
jgi:hypothetical protein